MLGAPNISTSGDEDPVGACTLLIVLETEKDSGRMIIDAKIETLYQDTGDHVLDIQLLATLLGYVKKYCTGRDIKHLSIITMAEHPTWLTRFFTLAGFSPCQCLKSDDLEKGQRVCLKLDKSIKEPAKVVEDTSKPSANGTNENYTAAPKLVGKPPSLTIKSAAPAKVLDEDEAAKWLSQNQQILSPASTLAHPVLPKPDVIQTPTRLVKQSPKIGVSGASELPHSGEKRKHSETFPRDHDAEATGRTVRRREENGARERTKQEMREEEERLNLSLQKHREALQRASDKKVSGKMAGSMPPASKPNPQVEERSRKTADMTDALLAQYSKQSPVTSSISIKKEAPKQASPPISHLTPAVRGGSPDPSCWRSNTLPAKSLTCFYWASQGYCLKDERDCLHAHYHTGEVARPPPSYKYKAYKNGYYGPPMGVNGAVEEEYDPHHPGQGFKAKHGGPSGDTDQGADQGMSIRGLDNGSKNVKEEKGAPTQPKVYEDMKLRPGDNPYDSYRPRH